MNKKVIAVCAATVVCFQSLAQDTNNKPMNYGISLGANLPFMTASADANSQTVSKTGVTNSAGFRLGLLAERQLNKHFVIAAASDLSFYGSQVRVHKKDNSIDTFELPPVVEVALHMRYNILNAQWKPWVQAGPSYRIPLLSNTLTTRQLVRSIAAIDVGIGADRKFNNFCMSYEVRYSYGLTNISGIDGVKDINMNSLAVIVGLKKR